MKKINKWDIAKRLADNVAIKAHEADDEKLRIAYSESQELKKETTYFHGDTTTIPCRYCGMYGRHTHIINDPMANEARKSIEEDTKFKGTKESVCNDCYDDGFKGSPCPHIEVEELKKEWENLNHCGSLFEIEKFWLEKLAKQQEGFVKIPADKIFQRLMSADGLLDAPAIYISDLKEHFADIKSKIMDKSVKQYQEDKKLGWM